jgi:SET domain
VSSLIVNIMAKKTTKQATPATLATPTHHYGTRFRDNPSKRKPSSESWEVLEERGKWRRRDEDEQWRRRDSLTQLIASIYADIDAAIDIQRRIAGNGDPLSEEEQSSFETSEDLRLDYLRELRLAEMFAHLDDRNALRHARVPRGKRFDPVRAARDVVIETRHPRREQLVDLIDSLGWTMVAVCLPSDNFRERFIEHTDAEDFTERQDLLTSHRQPVTFFAKTRLFDCLERTAEQQAQDVLFRDLRSILAGIGIHINRELSEIEAELNRVSVVTEIVGLPADGTGLVHPHEWKLSADGQSATRLDFVYDSARQRQRRVLQENIEESRVLPGERWGEKRGWVLKHDPRYRSTYDDPCQACNDSGEQTDKKWKSDCQCTLNELKTRLAAEGAYYGDRVELRQISPVMGTGVVALQRFPAGSVLAEYVGEIYPNNRSSNYNNHTYLLSQRRNFARNRTEEAMYIDPSIHGDWTRFINHSCESNTEFVVRSCGDKMLTCIVVGNQPIEFGQQLTVNYGREYFVNQNLACRCGRDSCRLWNADNVNDRRTTLRQAKEQGIAPGWAN